jgi:hypothetical protein
MLQCQSNLRATRGSPTACAQHAWEPFFGIKILFGQFTSGARMVWIGSVDLGRPFTCPPPWGYWAREAFANTVRSWQVVRVIVRAIILSSFAEERNQNLKIDSTFLRAKNLFASQFVADVQEQIAVGANNPRQEKRIAFARALVQQPEWLFLDEATSAVDEPTEARLYRLVRERLATTTVFSVGHRATLRAFHSRQLLVRANGTGPSSIVEMTAVPESARGNPTLPTRDKVAALVG